MDKIDVPIACNYNPSPTVNIDNTDVLVDGYVILWRWEIIDNDADDDGVCDLDEIVGCQDASACNYMEVQQIPLIVFLR